VIVGAYGLVSIFAAAILIHTMHGDFAGIEVLVMYGVAVWVCLVYRRESQAGSQ
jgi:hypothetical protein